MTKKEIAQKEMKECDAEILASLKKHKCVLDVTFIAKQQGNAFHVRSLYIENKNK